MITSIITTYGQRINIGDNYKNYFSGDFVNEKIVVSIYQTINSLIYRVLFKDDTYVDIDYQNISKINEKE